MFRRAVDFKLGEPEQYPHDYTCPALECQLPSKSMLVLKALMEIETQPNHHLLSITVKLLSTFR